MTRAPRAPRVLAAALLLSATLIAAPGSGVLRAQRAPARDTAGMPVLPLDWRVRTLDGEDVDLRRYRGRPLFLNFWATWCAPCVAELGSIAGLRDSLAARGADDIVFLLVAPETRGRVAAFASRHRLTLPFVVERDPLPALLGVRAVPSTWLIDRAGHIAYAHRGAATWDAPSVVDFVFRTLP